MQRQRRSIGNIGNVVDLVRGGRFLETCGGLGLGGLPLVRPRLDHVGFAVRSLDAGRRICEGLGLQVTGPEIVLSEGVRIGIVSVGSERIELLQGLGEETVIGRFVSRHGEGVHHIALRVHALDALFKTLIETGVRLANAAVGIGAGGQRYFFVHPEATGGTLLELVEDREEVSS